MICEGKHSCPCYLFIYLFSVYLFSVMLVTIQCILTPWTSFCIYDVFVCVWCMDLNSAVHLIVRWKSRKNRDLLPHKPEPAFLLLVLQHFMCLSRYIYIYLTK